MIDEPDLKAMSPGDRAQLARALTAIDGPPPPARSPAHWRRRLFIAFFMVCALVLAAWIGVLAVTLPRHYRAGGWQATWVGFDIALLFTFVAAGWAAWRRRQLLILCLVVLATLLCCDAWFDTTLDWGTSGFMVSLISALAIELPLAGFAAVVARRLLRLTIGRLEDLEGRPGPVPQLWRVPLFGGSEVGYREVLRRTAPQVWPAHAEHPEVPEDAGT